jgi:membrane-associated phospholipid phosphatase
MEGHPVARWLVVVSRRYRRQLRFLWDRLTPGGSFGLEFTSLMAILAVALFVLVAYGVVVGQDAGPTPGDTTAVEVAESLRSGWLTDVAETVTHLGAGALVWALGGVCAAFLVARRRWLELAVLLSGLLLTTIGVHELKAAIDRPRPEDGLTASSGSAYPSGHAAYSVLYVWLALTLVLRLRPGMARGAAVIAAGFAITIAVGLSRVYLGVHYLSDVSGGWALGAAAFSLCAAVALVISQLRQNPRQ